jgi:hypothetical protein
MRTTARREGHRSIIGVFAALALAASWSGDAGVDARSSADDAFQKFWSARNPREAEQTATDVVSSTIPFDEAFKRLRAGRPFGADVARGIVRLSRRNAGGEFFYDLNVPDSYDSARRYQVRFQLHGGVRGRSTSQPRGEGSIGALAGAEQIYVLPYAWDNAPWWSEKQVENLRGILDAVKRTYNVDENRVAVAGVSDGATATYYIAMRDTTPYASFESLNGFYMVLTNRNVGASDVLFLNNLVNKPFFLVNGGLDPLYPLRNVDPFVEHLKRGGVTIDYRPQPDGAHNTSWWPILKDSFESFVREHPRDPYPSRITWESTGTDIGKRAHWLVIDRVAASPSSRGAPLPDLNRFARPQRMPTDPPPPTADLFKHAQLYGRVNLVRSGNVVDLTTRDVGELTLLLSPDIFDFAKPVKVTANDRVAFDGRVEKSVETLMKWAARDNDRTMLFGAELHLKIE